MEISDFTKEMKKKIDEMTPVFVEREEIPYKGLCNLGESCPICEGIGYFRRKRDIADPMFGKLDLCPNVDVWKVKGAETYGLQPEEVEELTWDRIRPIAGEAAVIAAQEVRQAIDRGWGWVYLWGTHGQAKTLILQIAVAEALKKNQQAGYANMADIIAHLQKAFDTEYPSSESQARLDFWGSLPILAIDEFNRFNKTKWAETSQFRLMDSRNTKAVRHEALTLIASNQSPEELDPYYKSRIYDGRFQVVKLDGIDARPFMTEEEKY